MKAVKKKEEKPITGFTLREPDKTNRMGPRGGMWYKNAGYGFETADSWGGRWGGVGGS